MTEEKNTLEEEYPTDSDIDSTASKRKRLVVVIAIVLAAAIPLGCLLFHALSKGRNYSDAITLYNKGQYEQALEAFTKLGDYKDSEAQRNNCCQEIARMEREYTDAVALYDEGEYEEALEAFAKLGTYKDSTSWQNSCRREMTSREALSLYNAGEYKQAWQAFIRLSHYAGVSLDTAEYIESCREQLYAAATELYESKCYDEAAAAFEALATEEYGDSRALAEKSRYLDATEKYNGGKYDQAIAGFTALSGYKDSVDKIRSCKERLYASAMDLYNAGETDRAAEILITLPGYGEADALTGPDGPLSEAAAAARRAQFDVGKTVTFGAYEGEAIEWLVLEAEGDERVMITLKGLETKPFHKKHVPATWETCSLRQWLNGEFYEAAFSPEEQATIVTTNISADKNPDYDIDPGNPTEDKVYILGIEEAKRYFADDAARVCYPTERAKTNGASVGAAYTDYPGACWWWLRSPGYYNFSAVNVFSTGQIQTGGYFVNYKLLCVRPVIKIRLS